MSARNDAVYYQSEMLKLQEHIRSMLERVRDNDRFYSEWMKKSQELVGIDPEDGHSESSQTLKD